MTRALSPEYRRRIEIGSDGSITVWESEDGEHWILLPSEPAKAYQGEPHKSETFFGSSGVMTVDYYDDGTVTVS